MAAGQRHPVNHCVGHLELRIPRDGKWWLQASWQHQHGGPELFVKDIFVISEKSEKGYLKAKHLPAVFSSIYSSFFSNLLATGLTLGSACSFLWFSQSQVLPFCHCSIFSVFVYYVPCVPSLFSLLFSFLFCRLLLDNWGTNLENKVNELWFYVKKMCAKDLLLILI